MPRLGHLRICWTMLALFVSTCLLSYSVTAQTYSIAEIGTFGGAGSSARDVNNFGEVVGAAQNASGQYRPYIWVNGVLTELGTLGGNTGAAHALNDDGVVVGEAQNANGFTRAVIWDGLTAADLGVLAAGGTSGSAQDINNDNTVVGYADGNAPFGIDNRAFRWTLAGGMADLGTLGGFDGEAHGIANNGAIAGCAAAANQVSRACRFDPDPNLQLSSATSLAYNVSLNGTSVGYFVSGGQDRAAKWVGATPTNLGTLAGHTASYAYHINNANQIVGRSQGASGSKAVIWNNSNTPTDLNTLISANSGWTLTSAVSINDFGQIVGFGNLNGASRGYVLTPLLVQVLDPAYNSGLIAASDITTNTESLGLSDAPNVIGVTCDGVTRVVLRVKGLPGSGDVSMILTDNSGGGSDYGQLRAPGQDKETEGSTSITVPVTTLINGQHMAFVIFDAPDDFVRADPVQAALDRVEDDRSVNISISYESSGGGDEVTGNLTLQLRRPPLLLLHGLNSSSSTWKFPGPNDLQNNTDPRFIVYAENYGPTATNSFIDNVRFPKSGCQVARFMMNRLGYACTQVDVVGHSMGGILSRMFVSNHGGIGYRRPSNFNEGDINRLISLDTPHHGSPLATAAIDISGALISSGVADAYLNAIEARLGCITCGAVADLRPDSLVISNMAAANVPAHAIVSVGMSDIFAAGGILPAGEARSLDRIYSIFGVPLHFVFPSPLEHDAVVERSSQEGSLLPTHTTLVHYDPFDTPPVLALHFTNTTERFFSTTIVSLLNKRSVDSTVFAPAGFPSGFGGGGAPTIPNYGSAVNGLSITAPSNGITVSSGDSIPVAISAINGFQPSKVMVSSPFGVEVLTTAPYTTSIDVPDTAIGDFDLQVLAFDANWDAAAPAAQVVHVTVPPLVTLVSLEVRPTPLAIFDSNPIRPVQVFGTYSDGVTREITSPTLGTTFQMDDPDVAMVDANGIISSVSVGTTSLVVSNGSIDEVVPVYVERIPCPGDVTDNGLVNVEDLLAVIAAWGPCVWCATDINKDDVVNVSDLLAVISDWGDCQ